MWYEIVWPDHSEEHPRIGYMLQVFSKKGSFVLETPGRKDNVWAWDGNRDAPTLAPSFLCEYPGAQPPVRVHLFLNAGRISLCSDSTVQVAEGS